MIEGVVVRELPSSFREEGLSVEIWEKKNAPAAMLKASCRMIPAATVEAWFRHDRASERIVCLTGMLKLVLCDRREGTGSSEEVMELFLGEYSYREVVVPPGVWRGWKTIGERPALVLVALDGEGEESASVEEGEAGIPYNWDIVMR